VVDPRLDRNANLGRMAVGLARQGEEWRGGRDGWAAFTDWAECRIRIGKLVFEFLAAEMNECK
jgi:hypothetical protein